MKANKLIKEYMKSKGLSQEALAVQCQMSQAAVSRHLSGQRSVGVASAIRYERGTGGALQAAKLLGLNEAA
jgi:transcriptional regulator with XRE-family HTH domain